MCKVVNISGFVEVGDVEPMDGPAGNDLAEFHGALEELADEFSTTGDLNGEILAKLAGLIDRLMLHREISRLRARFESGITGLTALSASFGSDRSPEAQARALRILSGLAEDPGV